jgi:tritrans,polycis-undecaprenyl-diphosphate synthase [geranylgeranyl-diphosphate specific]
MTKVSCSFSSHNQIKHIGFIMDGNRRYARKYAVSLKEAYALGLKVFSNMILVCLEKQVKEATFYALSLDNVTKRKQEEVDVIYTVAIIELRKKKDFFLEHRVKITFVGLLDKLSLECRKTIHELESIPEDYVVRLTVFILVAYDPKLDLLMIHQKIGICQKGAVSSLFINPVDLIVRTGGKNRLSGFLPFQSIYADLVTLNVFWPEFKQEGLFKILSLYQREKKDYGK